MADQTKKTQELDNKGEHADAWKHLEQGLRMMETANNLDYNKAVECFNRAIEIKPNLPAAYNNKGLAYCNLHKFSEAIDSFDKAIKLAHVLL